MKGFALAEADADLIQFVKMWLLHRIVALKSQKGDLHQNAIGCVTISKSNGFLAGYRRICQPACGVRRSFNDQLSVVRSSE
jgi:hypothetical protein